VRVFVARIVNNLRRAVRVDSPSLIALGRLISMGLALITAPIVARAIGADGRGETAAAVAAFGLVPVLLAFGVPLEVRRHVSSTGLYDSVRTARILFLIATVPSTLVSAALIATIFANTDAVTKAAIFVGISLGPMMMSWMTDLSVLIAERKYRSVLVVQICQPAIYVSIVLVWWLSTGAIDTAEVLAANIAGTFVTAFVAWRLAGVPMKGEKVRFSALLARSAKLAGSTSAEAAGNQLHQVIALPLLGAYGAGLYSIAATIGALPLAIGHAISASYFSEIARTTGVERQKMKASAARMAIVGSAIACVPVAAAAPVIIPVLFGNEFVPAISITWIYLLGSFAMVVGFVVSMNLAAEGSGGRMTFTQIVSLVVGTVLLVVLGSRFGGEGAAGAMSTSYVLALCLLLVFSRIRPRDLVPGRSDAAGLFRRIFRNGK
jgi:O-antigen/teichoic acid export membrane protein